MSIFLSGWTKNQRLKKVSVLGFMWKQALVDIEMEPRIPFNSLMPTNTLRSVTLKDLEMNFINQNEHRELLRQLPIEIINSIASQDLVLHTDGCKTDMGTTGSGALMKTTTGERRYSLRNPHHSSVFSSELVAIKEALNLALDSDVDDVWIFTDSRSSIQ